ncbi:hypothetical protein ACFLS9_06020 [Bacteroidota bacterium]
MDSVVLEKLNSRFFLLFSLIILLFFTLNETAYSQIRGKYEKHLAEADSLYNFGRFDQAIELLMSCLEKEDISSEEKMRTYRLLGLTYIAKDYEEEARNAIKKLLEMVPNYKSDPDQDAPKFIVLLEDEKHKEELAKEEEVKEEIKEEEPVVLPEEKEEGINWLYYAGGAVVAVVVAVVVLISGGGDDGGGGNGVTDTGFKDPPGRPE